MEGCLVVDICRNKRKNGNGCSKLQTLKSAQQKQQPNNKTYVRAIKRQTCIDNRIENREMYFDLPSMCY